jgi:ribonuclease HI
MNTRSQTLIYADGSCDNKARVGGWGYVLIHAGGVRGYGHAPAPIDPTTSNKMELTAVLMGLRDPGAQSGHVVVRSDSQYVMKGLNEWSIKWIRNGWRTYEGEMVKNRLEWKELLLAIGRNDGRTVEFSWTKGHVENSNPWNHVADYLAAFGRDAALKARLIEEVKSKGPDHVFSVKDRPRSAGELARAG